MNECNPITSDIRQQLVESLKFLVDRQSEAYPFFDTKFDLLSGDDFAADDSLRGRDVIYSWIQGRGLEAIVEHRLWLELEAQSDLAGRDQLVARIDLFLPLVIQSMETLRDVNHGRLPFMMWRDGTALTVDANGDVVMHGATVNSSYTLSDLFYVKGLMAAACWLKSEHLIKSAEALLWGIIAQIREGAFRLGQVGLDPKNPVQEVVGRHSHAARMIGVGAATLFYRCTQDSRYRELGLDLIQYILKNHVESSNRYQHLGAVTGDFWEFVDEMRDPWLTQNGVLLSDSGHANEYVGLALAHLKEIGEFDTVLSRQLVQILIQNYSNGFTGAGIVKSYDLATRSIVNSDMPWWSLPETMRAAHLALQVTSVSDQEASQLRQIYDDCWRAYSSHYVLKQRGFLAIQCIDSQLERSLAIPAVPDVDPCYHTGLSLLGCL